MVASYRSVVSNQSSTAKATALVGISSVLLGFDISPSQVSLDDLLGFAISRMDVATGAMEWLRGQKRFKGDTDPSCESIASNVAPIQQFRWGDYSLNPASEYLYRIYPVVGIPGELFLSAPVTLQVITASNRSAETQFYFGRGAGALPEHPNHLTMPALNQERRASASLSRGLESALLGFINAANTGDDLKLAVSQFEHPAVADALKRAIARGVRVQMVSNAKPHSAHGDQHAFELPSEYVTRRRRRPQLRYSNFVVHSSKGTPRRVWISSADLTEPGLIPQTNIGIIFHQPLVARTFDQFFCLLQQDLPLNEMKNQVVQLMAHSRAGLGPTHRIYFAPVKDIQLLRVAWDMVWHAQQAVFLGCPNRVDRSILDALRDSPSEVLCYGIVRRVSNAPTLELIDRTTYAIQDVPVGIESSDHTGSGLEPCAESRPYPNLLIVDPSTKNPRVLVSLGDLCDEPQRRGDAHAILIEKDSRSAAIVGTELMRMFDGYKLASFMARAEHDAAIRYLAENGSWAVDYYNPFKAKFRERIAFVGL